MTEAKNQVSALIDRVRRGERVVIEDRGRPVAHLEPVPGLAGDEEGRVARLDGDTPGASGRPHGETSWTELGKACRR